MPYVLLLSLENNEGEGEVNVALVALSAEVEKTLSSLRPLVVTQKSCGCTWHRTLPARLFLLQSQRATPLRHNTLSAMNYATSRGRYL